MSKAPQEGPKPPTTAELYDYLTSYTNRLISNNLEERWLSSYLTKFVMPAVRAVDKGIVKGTELAKKVDEFRLSEIEEEERKAKANLERITHQKADVIRRLQG